MQSDQTPRGREIGAWVGALLLHFCTLGLLRSTLGDGASSSAPQAVTQVAAGQEFEVELGPPNALDAPYAHQPRDEPAPARADSDAHAALPTKPLARVPAADTTSSAASQALEPAENTERSPAPEPASGELEPAKTDESPTQPNRAIDLGIGPDGWKQWTRREPSERAGSEKNPRRGSSRPLVRAPAPSKTGGLQEGLEADDRARGLGPSGRVATAFFQATHSNVAPQLGVAHFDITVLRSGAVEISLTGANRESEKWRAVASAAALALRKAPPRIPPSRDGVRFKLDVTAEETYPNGAKPGSLHGARLEFEPPVLQSGEAAQEELKELNPVASQGFAEGMPLVLNLPGVYVSGRGKVCSYRIGLSALGPLLQGGCDLSNIGTKPQRMVRVAVQDQSFF